MSTTKTLAKGTAWGIIATGLLRFVGLFYYIVLANLATQEEIGIFFLALSVMEITMIFSNMGLGSGAVSRYVPYYAGRKEFNNVRKVLRITLSAGTILSAVCMAGIVWFAPLIASFFHEPALEFPLQVMSSYLLINNIYAISINFLQGRKKIKLTSKITSLQGILKLVLAGFFLRYLGTGPIDIILSFLLSFMISGMIAAYYTAKDYTGLPRTEEKTDTQNLLKEMIPYGLMIVTLASMNILNSRFDRMMLGYLLPSEVNTRMIAVYAVVISFSTLINTFSTAISNIFYPIITEFWGSKQIGEIKDASAVFIRWIGLSTTPVMVMIACFSGSILSTIYGENYTLGNYAMIIYSLGLFTYSFSYPSQRILSATKKLTTSMRIILVGLITNVILNYMLIPLYGLNGAALASAVSFVVMAVSYATTKESFRLSIIPNIRKPLTAGILSIAAIFLLKELAGLCTAVPDPTFFLGSIANPILRKVLKLGFLGALAVFTGIIYTAFLVLLKTFIKEDIDLIRGAMTRMKIPKRWINRIVRVLSQKT